MKRLIILMLVAVFLTSVFLTRSQWDGDITEAVSLSLAAEAGAGESRILPWSIDGDLLLFLFLAGGAAAGFAAGYYWRVLFAGGREKEAGRNPNPDENSGARLPPRAAAGASGKERTR